MKKNYLGLLLFFLLGIACNKGTVDLSTKENTLTGYTVEGIYDLTLNSNSSNGTGQEKLRLSIAHDSGLHENLKVSLQGVPENVSTSITPSEGVAPFQTEIVFTLAGTPKPGKYPVKFIVTAPSGRTKVSTINLTIPIVDIKMEVQQPGDFYIYNNGHTQYVNAVSVFTFGIKESIELSFSNLPAGAEAVFSLNNMPNVYADISFNATNVKNGTYPILLNAKTSTGITESYSTNLVVNNNCAPSLLSEKFSKMLRYKEGVLVDSVWMDVRLEQNASQANAIQFYGYNYGPNSYNVFRFILNCNDQTIKLEKQYGSLASVNYTKLEGKGYFDFVRKEIVIDCILDNGERTKIIITK